MRSTGLTDPLTWTPEAQAGGEKRGAMGGWTTHRPPLGAKCSPQLGRNRDQNQDEIPAPETSRGRSLTASGKK